MDGKPSRESLRLFAADPFQPRPASSSSFPTSIRFPSERTLKACYTLVLLLAVKRYQHPAQPAFVILVRSRPFSPLFLLSTPGSIFDVHVPPEAMLRSSRRSKSLSVPICFFNISAFSCSCQRLFGRVLVGFCSFDVFVVWLNGTVCMCSVSVCVLCACANQCVQLTSVCLCPYTKI